MLAQHLGAFVRRHRPRQPVTLHFLAAFVAQELQLVVSLDAFGDHGQLQRMGHRDDGPGDGGVVWIDRDVADESLVDLDGVDRQSLQTGRRDRADANAQMSINTLDLNESDPVSNVRPQNPVLCGFGNVLKLEVVPAIGGRLSIAVLLLSARPLHKRLSR